MYEKRNTISLIIAIVLISAVGLMINSALKKKHSKLASKSAEMKRQYEESSKVAETLPEVQFKYDSLRTRWLFAPKKIYKLPEPQLTVSYMVWLINENNLDLPFEFKLQDIQRLDIISNFVFTLSGVASYENLYTFIYYMTKNPLLYKFEKINLRRIDTGQVEYELQIKGFFLEKDILPDDEFSFNMQRISVEQNDFHDIFYTTFMPPSDKIVDEPVQESVTPEVEIKSDLIDPENASLLALTNSMAYVLDEYGEMKRLSPGSPVRGGTLASIDLKNSRVQFQLYGGKRITLGLGYTK